MLMDLIIPGIRDPCLLPVEEASDSNPYLWGYFSAQHSVEQRSAEYMVYDDG
jgi:hypothetical protein